MSFTNMKIGARMGAGFGLVLVLVLLVAAFGLIRISQIQGHLDQVTGDHMVKIKLVGTMRDTLQTVAISVRNLVLLTDDGAMEAEAKRIQAERTLYAEASRKQAAMVTDEEAAYARARVFLLFKTALSRLPVSLAAWLITRSITTPIKHAVKLAQTVSTGDLTQRIDIHSTDEVGQLMQALKDMNASLVTIVGQVRHGTETIAVASREIASGNADLSSRTESQASSQEATASSMEAQTSPVKQN